MDDERDREDRPAVGDGGGVDGVDVEPVADGDDGARGGGEPSDPTLRLDDALKLTGAVATGGQAKALVQAGRVTVNGAVETRRKRRLRAGDVIGLDGETFEIDLRE